MSVFTACDANEPGAKPVTYMNGTTLYAKEEYQGLVLSLREKNGSDDSDFFALIWDPKGPFEVFYDTTRFGMNGRANVDATPEVKALYEKHIEAEMKAIRAQSAALKAAAPEVGKTVTINLKAGKNKSLNGQVGQVFWVGRDQYARNPYSAPLRVGVKVGDTKVFLSEKNVTVLIPETV